jgi:hypothetical protein
MTTTAVLPDAKIRFSGEYSFGHIRLSDVLFTPDDALEYLGENGFSVQESADYVKALEVVTI